MGAFRRAKGDYASPEILAATAHRAQETGFLHELPVAGRVKFVKPVPGGLTLYSDVNDSGRLHGIHRTTIF